MEIKSFIESRRFEMAIMGLIIFNAITLDLESDADVMNVIGPALNFSTDLCWGYLR